MVLNPTILEVDESRCTAKLLLWWVLTYQDDRAFELVNEPYTSCSLFCASRPSLQYNPEGMPQCCDNVFIPASEAINAR